MGVEAVEDGHGPLVRRHVSGVARPADDGTTAPEGVERGPGVPPGVAGRGQPPEVAVLVEVIGDGVHAATPEDVTPGE